MSPMATVCALSSPTVAFRPQIKARARRSLTVSASATINPDIQKDVDKVVNTISTADIKGKGVYCRCWRSATFPMCNGAHVKHNKETGDNVGPLIIAKE